MHADSHNCPVFAANWNNVQDFIKVLNSKSGKNYRLPTEAEWEYACRGGGKKEKFCGGDDGNSVAWYSGNSEKVPHPVAQKQPNSLGIYDMSGNQAEWTADWYDREYYSKSPRNNPQGPATGVDRVIRGGASHNPASFITPTARNRWSPEAFSGFRLVSP